MTIKEMIASEKDIDLVAAAKERGITVFTFAHEDDAHPGEIAIPDKTAQEWAKLRRGKKWVGITIEWRDMRYVVLSNDFPTVGWACLEEDIEKA